MLPKLIVLAGIVALVWKVFQFGARFGAVHQQRQGQRAARVTGAARPDTPPTPAAEDLRRCRACGAYVAAASSPCGRSDCPQRRT